MLTSVNRNIVVTVDGFSLLGYSEPSAADIYRKFSGKQK